MRETRRPSDSSAIIESPRSLPYYAYPSAVDIEQHGLQKLPAVLPIVDFTQARPYRSRRYTTLTAAQLTPVKVLQMAEVVAASFAKREPMVRHLRLYKCPPPELTETNHVDPFGRAEFGAWNKESLMYWFIRLFVLTNPSSPKSHIPYPDQ